ncbi:MAG TPA: hypothetical protein VJL31_19700 [Gemmatimonadales bacterium]|nr:hypothetical protein [Gemmatimonadales bacterium]
MSRPGVTRSASLAVLLAALSAGCASKRIMVPPRLDLQPHGSVGLVTFTVENAKGQLHDFATQRFAEEVLAAQSGIELLELGNADSLVRRVGETSFGPASAQALGEQRGVPAVFVGHLKVSNVKPSGGIIGLQVPFVQATVTVDLLVRLISTRSGGTLWRSSASASQKVGSVAIVGGIPEFSAKDPNDAYGELVNSLVWTVTHDLRPTWRRQ